MIRNDEQLAQAIEQVERMYRAVLALRTEVLPHSSLQYALMAEGPLEEIRSLHAAINSYVEEPVPNASREAVPAGNGDRGRVPGGAGQ